jgi:hypothetical protein
MSQKTLEAFRTDTADSYRLKEESFDPSGPWAAYKRAYAFSILCIVMSEVTEFKIGRVPTGFPNSD